MSKITCYGCGKLLFDVDGKFDLTIERLLKYHESTDLLITCRECGEIAANSIKPPEQDEQFNQILKENKLI